MIITKVEFDSIKQITRKKYDVEEFKNKEKLFIEPEIIKDIINDLKNKIKTLEEESLNQDLMMSDLQEENNNLIEENTNLKIENIVEMEINK